MALILIKNRTIKIWRLLVVAVYFFVYAQHGRELMGWKSPVVEPTLPNVLGDYNY